MSLARLLICLAAAVLTAGCGTIEDNAWTNGVPREETIIQVNAEGPWTINYINPADDPRKK